MYYAILTWRMVKGFLEYKQMNFKLSHIPYVYSIFVYYIPIQLINILEKGPCIVF